MENISNRHKSLIQRIEHRTLICVICFLLLSTLALLKGYISRPGNQVFYYAIRIGFWISLIIFLFHSFIFYIAAIEPSTRYRVLHSNTYKYLHDNGFVVSNELTLEGVYNDFHINVDLMDTLDHRKKVVLCNIVEGYYNLPAEDTGVEHLSGEYYFGFLEFKNHRVLCMPWNPYDPDFEKVIVGLATLLKREKLSPLSREEWLENYRPLEDDCY